MLTLFCRLLGLLEAAWTSFNADHLASVDVHTFARDFPQESTLLVLRAYFEAAVALQSANVPLALRVPALLHRAPQDRAGFYALFGGHGNNYGYCTELQTLYDTYCSFVEPIAAAVQARFCHLLSNIALARSGPYPFHNQGLDLLSRLKGHSERRSEAYLASVPISAPLLSLARMIQFYVSV